MRLWSPRAAASAIHTNDTERDTASTSASTVIAA